MTSRCVMLAVVHDLAEATVGDITPDEGISKEEKNQLEEVSLSNQIFVLTGCRMQ